MERGIAGRWEVVHWLAGALAECRRDIRPTDEHVVVGPNRVVDGLAGGRPVRAPPQPAALTSLPEPVDIVGSERPGTDDQDDVERLFGEDAFHSGRPVAAPKPTEPSVPAQQVKRFHRTTEPLKRPLAKRRMRVQHVIERCHQKNPRGTRTFGARHARV